MNSNSFVGQSMRRKEDRRLLSGRGRFIADIRLPRMAHVAFARSSVAHARVRDIDVGRAKTMSGVLTVLTAKDIAPHLQRVPGLQNTPPEAWRKHVEHEISIPDQPLIADDKVRYVGEPYAIVVAENRYLAEDAVEAIELHYDELPVVHDIDSALAADAAKVHEHLRGNVVTRFRVRRGDEVPKPACSLRSIRRRFVNHRFSAMPIECRGAVAEYDERLDSMTIWSATQVVHWVRREVAKQLHLPEGRVRCIAPDVGGGFGVKGHVYPEEILVAYLARTLRRPIAWIEDRQEHLINSTHSRDDVHDAEILFDEEGKIFSLCDEFIKDSGAFTPTGIGSLSNTVTHIAGPYHIPRLDMTATLVVTNKTPNCPYRGTGRPEASFVIERMIDLVARDLDLDPVEVRVRNMIGPHQLPYSLGMPYRDGVMATYDSGDYPRSLQLALDALGGLGKFRERQKKAWAEGRFVGLGLACYVEGTGVGPFEGATIRMDPSGSLIVATGACNAGQGHETVFAQVAADEWGIRPDDVTLLISDTAAIANGYGSIASRSAVNSSGAIRKASKVLRRKVFEIAAHLLDCRPDELLLRDGLVAVKGVSNRHVSLKEVAAAAKPGWDNHRPEGVSGGLEVTEYFEPKTVTWSYGTHAGIVVVDPATGEVRIEKYVVAHDAGVLLNPMLATGQVMGGVCQGIGGCLLERVVYDASGQNLTGSLMDYLIPVAAQMPDFEIVHTESPSPLNELGVKGLGEGGVVGPPGVIVNGVCDALLPLDFEMNESFCSQASIVRALSAWRARRKDGVR